MSSRRYFCSEGSKKALFYLLVLVAFMFIIVVTVVDSAAARRRERTRTIVRINDFDNCHDRPVGPYHITSRKISMVGKSLYVANANGTCEKSTRKLEGFVANITKCSDRTKSRCEHFNRVEWKESAVLCSMFDSNLTPWRSVPDTFSPRFSCKNEKGPFFVRNMSINFDHFSKLNLGLSHYYIIQAESFEERMSPFGCFVFEVDFPRIRG